MGSDVEQRANRLLKGIVSDDLLNPYMQLLALGECPSDEAADVLGAQELVMALTDSGMAHIRSAGPARPRRLVPIPPELALHGALSNMTRQLLADHERLLDGQRRIAEAQPAPDIPTGESSAMSQLVQIITDREEIGDLSRALISTARFDWLTLDNQAVERPIDELSAAPPLPSFGGQVRCRSIYETQIAEHPLGSQAIEAGVKAGEEARLLPKIGMKMKLADESIALVPLTPTGMSGAMLIRSAVVVGALREYFELLWERAIPFGEAEPQSPLNEVQNTILGLLTQGLSDESIGRRLGLSTNTVRRHITHIREELGVETRWAAGAAAVRRGWIK
ncbi:LuxR C-terminal-related transcriptional regulator [Actinomadura adrarensis]|uniref:LuxR C-terminal-related transcriptional regulator n=1 Tax=Actinomadura adrarensis TaxID=1819600 RepID=A0ABW3CVF4_9ACTN